MMRLGSFAAWALVASSSGEAFAQRSSPPTPVAPEAPSEDPREAPVRDAGHDDASPDQEAPVEEEGAETGSGAPLPSGLRPPVLLQSAAAEYPPEAADAGLEGTVVLALTIDTEGRVSDAAIHESAGPEFDAAALAAAPRFRFSPALRDGQPVAARILYRYEFRKPPSPPKPALGDVRGQVVLRSESSDPVVGAEVTMGAASGEERVTRTDAAGRFEFADLPPGSYRVKVRATGLGALVGFVTVVAGEAVEPRLRLHPDDAAPPIEVTVQGPSEADALRRSAKAVHVIETEEDKRRTADLGEVMARSHGIGVRRAGGLGSDARFSLNGLTDEQVRFFLDELPLELVGYPFGVVNVPVNLVDRIEIYRGVLPIQFGADALGGAVHLVSPRDLRGTHASASYSGGSFETHRATLGFRHQHEPTGIFVRLGGFADYSDNDYVVEVEVPDERGRLSPAQARRFHDAYRAVGGSMELGLVDRPWARKLLLRAFVTDYEKELQHNVVMTVPYGGVEYGELATGANLRYEHAFRRNVRVTAVGGYSFGRAWFRDVSACVYDWFGGCVRQRTQPGEIESRPRDQLVWENAAFGRVFAGWQVRPQHAVRLSLAPTFVARTGAERRQSDPAARDPLSAERNLLGLVAGAEYQLDALQERLQVTAFGKYYLQVLDSEEPLPGGVFRRRDRTTNRGGVGSTLRYRFFEWLYAKASYEWTARLPRPDEVFGDAILVVANLELEPERSHNVNLGLTLDSPDTIAGQWRSDLNGFLREAEQLIVLLGNERAFSFQNVYGARSGGLEASAGWSSPRDYVSLDGNVTYVDHRNTSDLGTFGDFAGDRIPNRPWLFANGEGRVRFANVLSPEDEVLLVWNTRYVHGYYRGWESVGARNFKQTVDGQVLHAVALSYVAHRKRLTLTFTGEIQNVTDAAAFDFFGVQKPGRAAFFKITGHYAKPR